MDLNHRIRTEKKTSYIFGNQIGKKKQSHSTVRSDVGFGFYRKWIFLWQKEPTISKFQNAIQPEIRERERKKEKVLHNFH